MLKYIFGNVEDFSITLRLLMKIQILLIHHPHIPWFRLFYLCKSRGVYRAGKPLTSVAYTLVGIRIPDASVTGLLGVTIATPFSVHAGRDSRLHSCRDYFGLDSENLDFVNFWSNH